MDEQNTQETQMGVRWGITKTKAWRRGDTEVGDEERLQVEALDVAAVEPLHWEGKDPQEVRIPKNNICAKNFPRKDG